MKKKMLVSLSLLGAAAVTAFGATAAEAAQVNSSISQWYAGSVGAYRASTGSTQSIYLGPSCVAGIAGAPQPTGIQMQLQRKNGILPPVSEGNITHNCGSTFSWGTRSKGIEYRYQLNGYQQGGWAKGPFSDPNVTINY